MKIRITSLILILIKKCNQYNINIKIRKKKIINFIKIKTIKIKMYPSWSDNGTHKQYNLSATKKAKGWQEINKKWYFFDKDGNLLKDIWLNDKNNWYYLNHEGEMIKDEWCMYNNDWFYCDEDGKMLNSMWIKFDDTWYYLDDTGKMVRQRWIKYNNKWFYIDKDGTMAKDTYILNKNRYLYVNDKGELSGQIKKNKNEKIVEKILIY